MPVMARFPWLADRVPHFMRSWPWLRQFYWQQWELDEARERAEKLGRRLFSDDRPTEGAEK